MSKPRSYQPGSQPCRFRWSRLNFQTHRFHWPRLVAGLFLLLLAAPSAVFAEDTPPPLSGHDCADFDSAVWAQSVYDANPTGNPALAPGPDGVVCPGLASGFAPALWTTTVPDNATPAELDRVIDGDTIDVRLPDGTVERVRLILIDTPETKDPNRPVECYGAEATNFTTNLLTGYQGTLYLQPDVTDRDRYGRLLRYVWLDLGDSWRQAGQPAAPAVYLVNEAIARAGYAAQVTYPPDVLYVDQVRAAATFAREHNLGLWAACGGPDTPLTAQPAKPATSGVQITNAPANNGDAGSGNGAAMGIARSTGGGCDLSYPDFCIAPPPPDLDCGDIPAKRFTVIGADPHRFDGDHDGIGCEK